MTSVLLELRVKNRAPESASHVAVGHWPSSSNYLGSVKIVSAAHSPSTCRREEELRSYRSTPETDWTGIWSHSERRDCCCVNVCVSSDFYILSLSSTWCRIFKGRQKWLIILKWIHREHICLFYPVLHHLIAIGDIVQVRIFSGANLWNRARHMKKEIHSAKHMTCFFLHEMKWKNIILKMLKIIFFTLKHMRMWKLVLIEEKEIECVNKNIFKMKCFFHSVITHKDAFNLPLKATVKKKRFNRKLRRSVSFCNIHFDHKGLNCTTTQIL